MIQQVLATFADLFVIIFNGLLIVRILLSYFVSPENGFYASLVSLTEPILAPVRRVIPNTIPGLDLAPLATFFILQALDYLIHSLLGV